MIKFANGVDPDEAAQIDTVINDHEPSRYLSPLTWLIGLVVGGGWIFKV